MNFYPTLGELAGNMGERLLLHMVDSMEPREAAFFGLKQKEARQASQVEEQSNQEYIDKQEADLAEFNNLLGTKPEPHNKMNRHLRGGK